MTGWEWWAGEVGADTYGLGCEPTRAAVIAAAVRQLRLGDEFQIVEARSSTDARYEGADHVPFLRMRHHEVLRVPPTITSVFAGASA